MGENGSDTKEGKVCTEQLGNPRALTNWSQFMIHMCLWIAALCVVLISTNSTQFTFLEPSGITTAHQLSGGMDPFLLGTIFYVLEPSFLNYIRVLLRQLSFPEGNGNGSPSHWWVGESSFSIPAGQTDWEAYSAALCVSLYFPFPHGSLCLCLTMPPEQLFILILITCGNR